jgi:ABC-type phosphate/phosphonate transport system substrate-binding protein
MKASKVLAAIAFAAGLVSGAAHAAGSCPNDGVVRFGVEPYESAQRMLPVYTDLAKMIGDKLGCTVQLYVATSYNAEIEAMRNNKLEFGQFGPLGYVLAHLDPLAVRGDLPADFKARLASVLSSLDLHQLPEADQKFLASNENPELKTVPQSDAAYNQIRDLVSTLHIDLSKL